MLARAVGALLTSPLALLARAIGALLTGPLAFFVCGLIDVACALRLLLAYLWRSTIRRRWALGKG